MNIMPILKDMVFMKTLINNTLVTDDIASQITHTEQFLIDLDHSEEEEN